MYSRLFLALATLPQMVTLTQAVVEGRLDAMGNGRSALVDTLGLHWAKEALAMHLAQLSWLLIKLYDTRIYKKG